MNWLAASVTRLKKTKVALLQLEHRQGAHLPFQGREPVGGYTTIVCDAWPLRCQSYGYLHSLRWYQINTAWWQRHMCVNSLPKAALSGAAVGKLFTHVPLSPSSINLVPAEPLTNKAKTTLPLLHLLNGQYSMTIWVSRYQTVKPFWVLLQQQMTAVAVVRTWTLKHVQIICAQFHSDYHHSTEIFTSCCSTNSIRALTDDIL